MCSPGFSNSDELFLTPISNCHIADRNIVLVDLLIAALGVVVWLVALHRLFYIGRGFKSNFIPHVATACFLVYGIVISVLWSLKAALLIKVSDIRPVIMFLQGFSLLPFQTGLCLFVFSLMMIATSKELGARAKKLKLKFKRIILFLVFFDALVFASPYFLSVFFSAQFHAFSVAMVLSIIWIAASFFIANMWFGWCIEGIFNDAIKTASKKNHASVQKIVKTRRNIR